MELTLLDQAAETIKTGQRVMIALSENPSADAITAGFALAEVLEKMGKQATIASSQFQLPPHLGFLPKSRAVHPDLSKLRKFVITLDLSEKKVETLAYNVDGNTLKIFITPKDGSFGAQDVSAGPGDFEFDLAILLDVQGLAALGPLFEANAEFFYKTPIINIDHSPANDHFGQINLVDLVATSTSEIVYDLIERLDAKLLDEAIATNLLTGIITKTRCFRTPAVTPKALAAASRLIEGGAKREEIIRRLYQTKSLQALRLWGRALARIKEDLGGQFVWTLIGRADFEKTGSDETALRSVIEDLMGNTPKARIVVVLYESPTQKIHGLASSHRQVRLLELFKNAQPTGSEELANLTFDTNDLTQAEALVQKQVSQYLRDNRLIE